MEHGKLWLPNSSFHFQSTVYLACTASSSKSWPEKAMAGPCSKKMKSIASTLYLQQTSANCFSCQCPTRTVTAHPSVVRKRVECPQTQKSMFNVLSSRLGTLGTSSHCWSDQQLHIASHWWAPHHVHHGLDRCLHLKSCRASE